MRTILISDPCVGDATNRFRCDFAQRLSHDEREILGETDNPLKVDGDLG